MPQNHKKSNVFFMVSEFRRLEDALGPLGGPKIFKSITFSIETLKEFGTFPDRPISLRGSAARSRNRVECFRTTRRPKSLKIDSKWTPKLTQNHTTLPLDTTLISPGAPLTPIARKSSKMTSKRVPKMTSKSSQKRHKSEPATPWAPDGCPRWLQTLQNLDFLLQNLDFRSFFCHFLPRFLDHFGHLAMVPHGAWFPMLPTG